MADLPLNLKSRRSKRFALGIDFLGLGLLVPMSVSVCILIAPHTYRAICRVKLDSYLDVLRPEFHELAFGRDTSVRLRGARGTSLVEVEGLAATPEAALNRANRAVAELQVALSHKKLETFVIIDRAELPLRLDDLDRGFVKLLIIIIDRAELPLRPYRPHVAAFNIIGVGTGAIFGVIGAVLLAVGFVRRRTASVEPAECT